MQTQELPGKIGEKIPAGLLIYNCPKHGWEYGIHCFEATYPENRELWFIYLYGGIKALTDEQYGMLQSELQQGKRIFPFRFDPSELAELASIRTKGDLSPTWRLSLNISFVTVAVQKFRKWLTTVFEILQSALP